MRPNSTGSANWGAGQEQISGGQDPAQPRLFAEQLQDTRVETKQGHAVLGTQKSDRRGRNDRPDGAF